MPEIIVVSDAVEGISPREPVQQPIVEETVEAGRFVLRERVQQRSAEKEILEVFEYIHQERISERTQIIDAPMPQIFGNFPRSASRIVHRSSGCQCRRLRKRPSERWS